MQHEMLDEIGLEEYETEIQVHTTIKEQTTTQEVFSPEEKEFLKANGEVAFSKHYNKCPICGEKLTNIEGCLNCPSCGFSKCG
jgi:rubrerythrin